ncbi:extracellular solute-binding protein [Paenibacillus sp. TRM 82003]|nr:extracellular solute-binding protein [Paenibacillus sp. TRM 82003]
MIQVWGTIWKKAALTATAFAALTACAGGGGAEEALPALAEGERSTIKVMYYDERQFFMEFGNLFLAEHENIDVEVVSTQTIYQQDKDPIEGMKELIETEQPDVLYISSYFFDSLLEDGLLYELDAVIEQDGFGLDGILPAAVEKMRLMGDGKLYGLAPTFSSEGIFYNKSLFDKHGVPLPEDGMTLEEVVMLAERFPADGDPETRIYGLDAGHRGAGYNKMIQMGMEEGLIYLDPETRTITLNTESWQRIANTVLRMERSEAFYREEPGNSEMGQSYESYLMQDPFLTGRAAMTINGSYYMNQLKESRNFLEDSDEFEWDVVTAPVHPDTPDATTSFQLNNIFSVNAASANARAAWEFVKFVNSDKYARVTSRSATFGGDLPVRTEYVRNDDGKNLEAFYKLKPKEQINYDSLRKVPQSFFMEFDIILTKYWEQMVKEEMTVEEALRQIETEAQVALTNAFEAEPAEVALP